MPSASALPDREAIVVGSGPNGLAAAIVCARAGLRVTVYEAEATIGGAARTAAITLPGFLHDLGASIFPLGAASPFFRELSLAEGGLDWVHPRYPLAHPLDDGTAVVVERSLDATASSLGRDADVYRRIFEPFVSAWEPLLDDVLAPVHWPAHPWRFARFASLAALPAAKLTRRFRTPQGRALFAGLAAHGGEPLDALLTSAFALVLGTCAHAGGWPVARGGAQRIVAALAARLQEYGGRIECGRRVDSIDELPRGAVVLCDISPERLADLGRGRLPARFSRRLRRLVRRSAVYKVDWALSEPIPWRAEACTQAGTVHVGGTFEEIAESEGALRHRRPPEQPFVIVAQPSVCDSSRSPAGGHTAWGYCHVPIGSPANMREAIERQIERFAPGFRDCIRARHDLSPAGLMRLNANLVGGDITGGAFIPTQVATRPTWRRYRTPVDGLYLCSASTPPGAGVHGMCGFWAAQAALRDLRI